MPVTYTNSLRGRSFPQFNQSFLWLDDVVEDSAFIAFVQEEVNANAVRGLAVDRSGEPTLRWEVWEENYVGGGDEYVWSQVGTGERVIGTEGTYWVKAPWVHSSSLGYLGSLPLDVWGYWECDELGRALDLSSLVAPPEITGLTGSVSSSRVLTLQWQPDNAYTAYEVHEFRKVPDSTLKATVTEPIRVSGALAANQTLEYAVRGKTAAGGLGPFSDTVIVTITSTGGTVEPGGQTP